MTIAFLPSIKTANSEVPMNKMISKIRNIFIRKDAEKLCAELNAQLEEELKKDIEDIDAEHVDRITALLEAVNESPLKEYDPQRVLDRVYQVIKRS